LWRWLHDEKYQNDNYHEVWPKLQHILVVHGNKKPFANKKTGKVEGTVHSLLGEIRYSQEKPFQFIFECTTRKGSTESNGHGPIYHIGKKPKKIFSRDQGSFGYERNFPLLGQQNENQNDFCLSDKNTPKIEQSDEYDYNDLKPFLLEKFSGSSMGEKTVTVPVTEKGFFENNYCYYFNGSRKQLVLYKN
jgi:hypothetical protein